MDDEDIMVPDSPDEAVNSVYDKQRASLQTYLDSLPYECETVEDMQARLEKIVEKIYICAKAKNWLVLSTWDGMLQCWLLMRYPMDTNTRANLVRLYYELCLVPGVEPRVLRGWADMLSRLLSNKPGMKRKLEATDLQLQWQPLWRVLQRELWPKSSLEEASRNLVNILLYVAEQCKRYYPSSEIPVMLETFLPMLTKETILTMVPVLTCFLPPTHSHLYMPSIFKIWEAFNSAIIDDRVLELCGDLAEEHVSGLCGDDNDGGAVWKDVGIWTEAEWNTLMGKGLGSMNVPVGAMRGSSNTSQHADLLDKSGSKIKKSISKINALARILIYSMRIDGDVRQATPTVEQSKMKEGKLPQQTGYIAGSKAMDSLDRMLTSIESFFHPSNTGAWSLSLTTLIQRLGAEFAKRWKEEEEESCKTPNMHRLTPAIRRAFVNSLKTPALLAMFSKDPVCMSYAQGSLRTLATLEPTIVMPELLERAYGGLEVVNETHRTTAMLSMLSGISRPLVNEHVWLGGQKHIVPLLELCIPGIDLNDPVKTVCATMFILSVVQHIKIGDLSQSGFSFSDDGPTDDMDVDDVDHLPEGTEPGDTPQLSRAEERSLVRDSTANFADWVVSLFRRVFALYENLPEEGGRKNTTGGKQEESVLKSIKSMMDVVCLQLSDQLFDLVLNLVYDYATTNAKSNAVRAFGQLIACLARVRPEKTMAKFLPHCISQIEEELKHGASSIRTTSTHAAVPSDTTLHWNMAILRGCLGYGGAALLAHRQQILDLLSLLVEKTKSERGYTGTGRLITRILSTLGSTYPLNARFVNTKEWEDSNFNKNHSVHWGRLYEPQDVVIEWHVPNDDEIAFVLEIIDRIGQPALKLVESLLETSGNWDNVARNDFCRYLHACRAIWGGLSTFVKEQPKVVVNSCIKTDIELPELLVAHLDVKAGFTLTDPSDSRFQKYVLSREKFGRTVLRGAATFRQTTNGEDHIDAVIGITRAIDTYLLTYGLSRSEFDSMQKNYAQARDLNRSWVRQKDNSRMVFIKRAHVYHSGRVYMHALYRRRSELDDQLLQELVELSLSQYTRIRRQAQAVLHNVTGYYVRSTRLILPTLFKALEKGNDPDRMKGSLYILWNKGIAAYALADQSFHKQYLMSLLECQHEEKPSIQKLVTSLSQDCVTHLNEEATHTDAYELDTPRLDDALRELERNFSSSFINHDLLNSALQKTQVRASKREILYIDTVSSILQLASRPTTHWRYLQSAARFLYGLLRRDAVPSPDLSKFFLSQTISPQPTIRAIAQRAIVKLLVFIKIRSFSHSKEALWLDEWTNPFSRKVPIGDPARFLESLQYPAQDNGFYLDKINTGFLTWTPTVKGYKVVNDKDGDLSWEASSLAALNAIKEGVRKEGYIEQLSILWGQESSKEGGSLDFRADNVLFFKYLAKIFGNDGLEDILAVVDPLLSDADKYKQRAGAEILAGILRGSKHWTASASNKLWTWTTSRLNRIVSQIKPETLSFWETIFQNQLMKRDPRRNQPLVDWIYALPLEFNGDSAFEMTKSLSLFGILVDSLGIYFNPKAGTFVKLLFDNANSSYAEIRQHVCQGLFVILTNQWQPWYPSTEAFLTACCEQKDPLKIRPEILRMSELNDSSDLQAYSSAVLYVLSAVTLPVEYIETILDNFVTAIKSSTSWRIRLNALPTLVVFFYRNLLSISQDGVAKVMDVLLDCLADENVEVRQTASKVFSGVVRCSQRQSIIPLKNRFVSLARKTVLPPRRDPSYAESLKILHSAILGICALIESLPYSVEPWMPSLTEVLAPHATDPPPISTTIRKCASEFKKDTWHKDQLLFDEDQLQSLSTMLVGTSYYA
ncbi:Proteasome activator complex subunit 4 [Psilocybe cubensis]|uniref:Proteasome activator complex subunit 4 n=1 Tax=Psilocybe cubensis TaxID=181762 RepID=A0ACB8HHC9_PSICU|nr:Proteasome activator complex subunit 4 [Psilocybe cubensis]KAH9487094.1 Proteasome activator complex subunit 4 [Psilocybe cubensis]